MHVVVVLYAFQLLVLAVARVWPAIDVRDGAWRYVVVRRAANLWGDLLPGIGLLPQVTGQPVVLTRTNLETGEVIARDYDLICDVQIDHPALRGARYGRRLLDP